MQIKAYPIKRLQETTLLAVTAITLIAAALLPVEVKAQPKDKDVVDVKGRPGVISRDGADEKKDKKNDEKKDEKEPNNPLVDEKVEIDKNFDPPLADDVPPPKGLEVTIDFRKAELQDVVKFYSKLMKKNFIIADSLKTGKKITIIAPKSVSMQEAYRAFLAALGMNGLTLVPHGSFIKIVDAKKASKEDIPTRRGKGGLPFADIMETRLIQIEHVPYQDIEGILNKIKSADADIINYAPTNTLIITELATNMRRMVKIIGFLDQPTGADKIHMYQVSFADASDLAGKI